MPAGVAYATARARRGAGGWPAATELVAGEVAVPRPNSKSSPASDLAVGPRVKWAIGEERYSQLLQEKELLGYGAVTCTPSGVVPFDEYGRESSRWPQADRGKSNDWRATVQRLNQEHPKTPEEMRAAYEEWTEKARQFLIERELVTMPDGERCLVDPSPPFQRPILAVASYSSPPAFKPSLTGHFFVPFPPDGASEDEIQKRLETNSLGEIPTVSVHEAYPGHHWHLTWMQQNPRAIRKVLGTSYFTEGWGLYAERLMHEQGFFVDPKHVLYHLKDRIFRAARIVVDTALHTGTNFEESSRVHADAMHFHRAAGRGGPVLHMAL